MTESEKIEAIKALTEFVKVQYSLQVSFGIDESLRVTATNDANDKIIELTRSLNK